MPEVMLDGITGFVCDSEAEMRSAVDCLPSIDSEACRERARSFGAGAMANGYEAIYAELTGHAVQAGSGRAGGTATVGLSTPL